jgi:hypothetical protein
MTMNVRDHVQPLSRCLKGLHEGHPTVRNQSTILQILSVLKFLNLTSISQLKQSRFVVAGSQLPASPRVSSFLGMNGCT